MMEDQLTHLDIETDMACHLCGQIKHLLQEVCEDCIGQTLLRHLPRLRRVLEDKYGHILDEWLARGPFLRARWIVDDTFRVGRHHTKHLLKELVSEAVSRCHIIFDLPGEDFWQPTRIDQLIEHIYEQCEEPLQQLFESLKEAVSSAPADEAERELVDVATGRKRVSKRQRRDAAIVALSFNIGLPRGAQMSALLCMRYQSDKGRDVYAEVVDGEISSVWREVEEELPKEVMKLITSGNDW
jgi:hypothetical protein